MRLRLGPGRVALALGLSLLGCDTGGPSDAGIDAGPQRMDVELSAEPDPAEPTECLSAPPGPRVARAKHISCDAELVQGALAMGQVGDIVIENARARFVIRASGTGGATTIGAPAGGVIDAATQGGVDALKELLPAFGLLSMAPSTIEVVDAGGDDEARVRVLFEDGPVGLLEGVLPGSPASPGRLRGQLDYVLRAGESALRVEVSLTTAVGLDTRSAQVGVIALLGGQEVFQPGSGVLEEDNLGGAGTVILGERSDSGLALTVEQDSAEVLHAVTINLMRGPTEMMLRGELSRFDARLAVAPTAAEAYVAARPNDVVDAFRPDRPGGRLTVMGTPGDRIVVDRLFGLDARPAIRTLLDASGTAVIPLEDDTYTVRAGFRGHFSRGGVTVESLDEVVTVGPAPSRDLIVAASVDGDPDVPVRVTVSRSGEEIERFVARGETTRRLPPDLYQVVVSHGLEHDVLVRDVNLRDVPMRLEPDLARVLDTDGWVSVDLHLHSDLSTDGVHRVEDSLGMLAAEGVQAAAATDHDYITDVGRVGPIAGVDDRVALVSGVEVSTTTYGHINGYPLVPDRDLPGAGAPEWFDMTPSDVFSALRATGDDSLGGALVQINHPRLGSASYFGTLGLDRMMGRFTADPEALGFPPGTDLNDFGFEVIEVWNGYTRGGNEESFLDYLALFDAGRRFTMVGNSDSHLPTRPPGSPRSFVRVPDEASFDWTDLRAALARGGEDVTVAAAAFVTAELMGPAVGDTIPVHVRVLAPPWAELDRLRVYAGTEVTVDRAIAMSSDPVRLDEVIDVPLGGADFLVVRADGSTAPQPMQHFEPMGVTNPIVVP